MIESLQFKPQPSRRLQIVPFSYCVVKYYTGFLDTSIWSCIRTINISNWLQISDLANFKRLINGSLTSVKAENVWKVQTNQICYAFSLARLVSFLSWNC